MLPTGIPCGNAAVSPLGTHMACATPEGNIAVRLMDPLKNTIQSAEPEPPSANDIKNVLATPLNVVGVRSRSKITILRYANLPVNHQLLLAVYKNGEVFIITNPEDPTKCKVQQLFKFSVSTIVDACFSCDDQLIAFGCMNNEILIWDLVYGKFLSKLSPHPTTTSDLGAIKGLTFDHTGTNRIISLGDDKSLSIIKYDLLENDEDGRKFDYRIEQTVNNIISSAKLNKFAIKKIDLSIDDQLIIVPNTSKMKFSKISLLKHQNEEYNPLTELSGENFKSFMSLLSPNVFINDKGEDVYVFATMSPDGTLAIWKSDVLTPINIIELNNSQLVQDFVWCLDGTSLLVTFNSGTSYFIKLNKNEVGEVKFTKNMLIQDLDSNIKKQMPLIFERMVSWRTKNKDKKDHLLEYVTGSQKGESVKPDDKKASEEHGGDENSKVIEPAISGDSSTTKEGSKISASTQSKQSSPNKSSVSTTETKPVAATSASASTTATTAKQAGTPTPVTSTNNASSAKSTNTKKRPLSTITPPSSSLTKEMTKISKRKLDHTEYIGSVCINPQISMAKIRLGTPLIKRIIKLGIEDSMTLTIINGNGNETNPTKIQMNLNLNNQVMFTNFLPYQIHLITGNERYISYSTTEGNLMIINKNGKSLLPMIILGSPLTFLEINDQFLMAVTCIGEVFIWDLLNCKIHLKTTLIQLLQPRYPSNLSSLQNNSLNISSLGANSSSGAGSGGGVNGNPSGVNNNSTSGAVNSNQPSNTSANSNGSNNQQQQQQQQQNSQASAQQQQQQQRDELIVTNILTKSESLTMCSITSNGIPIVTLSNGQGYIFNYDIKSWVLISDSWWAFGSQYWDDGNHKNNANTGGVNEGTEQERLLHMMERHTNEELERRNKFKFFNKISKILLMRDGFENLPKILSINHLENKLQFYLMLKDLKNFKMILLIYIEKLAEFNLNNRLIETFNEIKNIGLFQEEEKNSLLNDMILICSKFKDLEDFLIEFSKISKLSLDNDVL